jgi:hypothetical protein
VTGFRDLENCAHRLMTALDKARERGTLNLFDRSAQYDDVRQIDLLRSLNESWSRLRRLEAMGVQKDAAIAELRNKLKRYQIVNTTLTAIITALAFKGLEVLFQALR